MSRTEVLKVRVEPQLLEHVKRAAEEDNRSVSDWVRLRLLDGVSPIPVVTVTESTVPVEVVTGTEIVEGPPPKEKALKAVKASADGKPVYDGCTHRASHARTIRDGETCKGCGGTTW